MVFTAKLRKIGNSQGIYIPLKVITDYIIGDVLTLEVITQGEKGALIPPKVITNDVKDDEVITPIHTKRLVFNKEKGINEWK